MTVDLGKPLFCLLHIPLACTPRVPEQVAVFHRWQVAMMLPYWRETRGARTAVCLFNPATR